MKKFFTVVPLQPIGGLKLTHYDTSHNPDLALEDETRFPIFHLMVNALGKGEKAKLYALRTISPHPESSSNDNVAHHLESLREELKFFENKYQFTCELIEISLPKIETPAVQAQYFLKLINIFQPDDMLYCCISYGEKPMPIVLFAALSYAAQARPGFEVERICYGQFDHDVKKAILFDVTPLFTMHQMANDAMRYRIVEPDDFVRAALSLPMNKEEKASLRQVLGKQDEGKLLSRSDEQEDLPLGEDPEEGGEHS